MKWGATVCLRSASLDLPRETVETESCPATGTTTRCPRHLKWCPCHAVTVRNILYPPMHTYLYFYPPPPCVGADPCRPVLCDQVAVFAAASEAFSAANINCSIQESLDRFGPVLEKATEASVPVRGYVSCVLGCPYEGRVAPEDVVKVRDKRSKKILSYDVALSYRTSNDVSALCACHRVCWVHAQTLQVSVPKCIWCYWKVFFDFCDSSTTIPYTSGFYFSIPFLG